MGGRPRPRGPGVCPLRVNLGHPQDHLFRERPAFPGSPPDPDRETESSSARTAGDPSAAGKRPLPRAGRTSGGRDSSWQNPLDLSTDAWSNPVLMQTTETPCTGVMRGTGFEARRMVRSYRQTIDASPEIVFPLLCPVREAEWLDGWEFTMIYSVSGSMEKGAVFSTGPAIRPAGTHIFHAPPTPAGDSLRASLRMRLPRRVRPLFRGPSRSWGPG